MGLFVYEVLDSKDILLIVFEIKIFQAFENVGEMNRTGQSFLQSLKRSHIFKNMSFSLSPFLIHIGIMFVFSCLPRQSTMIFVGD